MSRYFLDAEFIEDGVTIDLISLGIVCEDGREFYAENEDCDLNAANDWVKANVLPWLWHQIEDPTEAEEFARAGGSGGLLSRPDFADQVRQFMEPATHGKPEIWTYYGSYDWVVFCQLFGKMIDLPKGFPMFTMDIKQFAVMLGNTELPKQDSAEHHALNDARWNKQAYEFCESKTFQGILDASQAERMTERGTV